MINLSQRDRDIFINHLKKKGIKFTGNNKQFFNSFNMKMETITKRLQSLEVTLSEKIQQIEEKLENFCDLSFDNSNRITQLERVVSEESTANGIENVPMFGEQVFL